MSSSTQANFLRLLADSVDAGQVEIHTLKMERFQPTVVDVDPYYVIRVLGNTTDPRFFPRKEKDDNQPTI